MRWTTPKDEDERIIERLALLPICVNHECRWLEIVKIRQIYHFDVWWDTEFVNE